MAPHSSTFQLVPLPGPGVRSTRKEPETFFVPKVKRIPYATTAKSLSPKEDLFWFARAKSSNNRKSLKKHTLKKMFIELPAF